MTINFIHNQPSKQDNQTLNKEVGTEDSINEIEPGSADQT